NQGGGVWVGVPPHLPCPIIQERIMTLVQKQESSNRAAWRKAKALARRNIIYRVAREDEHEALVAISRTSPYLKHFRYRVIFSPPEAYARGWIRVAECDGEIVAFVSFWIKRNRILNIRHMGVHPDYRRHGIGRGLIEHVDAAVPKRGGFFVPPMVLKCENRNTEGMAFYQRLGFNIVKPALKGKGVEFHRERVRP